MTIGDPQGAEFRCYKECPVAWQLAKAMQAMGRSDPRFKKIWDEVMTEEERNWVKSWKGIVERGYETG